MRIQISVEILKPADVVWPVMIDVERWPEWTPSVTNIERLDSGPFGLGSSARIRQPRLMPMTWRVCDFQEGRFFTWETRNPGVIAIGRHEVEPTERGCRVTLTLTQSGWLATSLAPLFSPLARRYVQIEAQGLKQKCEQPVGRTVERRLPQDRRLK